MIAPSLVNLSSILSSIWKKQDLDTRLAIVLYVKAWILFGLLYFVMTLLGLKCLVVGHVLSSTSFIKNLHTNEFLCLNIVFTI